MRAVFCVFMFTFSAYAQNQDIVINQNRLKTGETQEVFLEFTGSSGLSRFDLQLAPCRLTLINAMVEQSGTWVPLWITRDSLKFWSATESDIVLWVSTGAIQKIYLREPLKQNRRLRIEVTVSTPRQEHFKNQPEDNALFQVTEYTADRIIRKLETRLSLIPDLK